jgi:hypothetical protein
LTPCQDYTFITFIYAFIKYFRVIIDSQFDFKQYHQGMSNCPIDGTKPEDVRVLDVVEQAPSESAQHERMHLLLHKVVGSWLNQG